ncbi:hypothetical protein [Pseudoalteromonas byunsanensis]|uniref:Uncharacterized protein n=1 Tax=Pseudoalteromonas byunsanensis TaxID=327939 RepID=A0A1S1N5Q6_9GAMM|nr:hypothetical protein [Pseudoalteromonas byunsanensis]OHU96572.1 hypothetical protein BIW53_04380 [Pseudoalteromonas byunsanensis]
MKLDKYILLSVLAVLFALLDSGGAMLGFWSITDADTRSYILAFEFTTLCLLLLNSLFIWRRVQGVPWRRLLATGCLASLLLCIFGDVVNFNLGNRFFDSSDVVKHDYLIDSVLFFAPGYAMLLLVMSYILKHYYNVRSLLLAASLSFGIATVSYINIVNANAGMYVTVVSYFYSLLISLVATSGILLWFKYGVSAPMSIWLCAIGLVLATLADYLIGAMWIFGNDGQGFYPLARELNWILYITSQGLVIHLPRVIELHTDKSHSNNQS